MLPSDNTDNVPAPQLLTGPIRPSPAAAASGWPEIEPSLLEDGRPALPAFPLDVLPSPWFVWVSDAAAGAGAPPDYVAQALLAAVAGLAGASVKACVTPSWSEPLILWQALVGEPSTGKTPALDAIGRPLATVETMLRRDDDPAQEIVVRDSALAALTRATAARPAGLLLWRDEATPWLKELAAQANDNKAHGQLLEAWAARAGLPVSIIGSLHPERLAEALQGPAGGLAARFLFAWPSPPAHRPLGDGAPPREDEAVTMLHRIAQLVGTPDRPLTLAFDAEALKGLDPVLARLGETARSAEGAEAAWLGKGRGTIVRLAAILALLDWSRQVGTAAPPRAVKRDHVQTASHLWRDYFWPHAGAVLDRAAPSDLDRQARRVARWLRAGAKARRQVSQTQVRIEALGKTVNAGRANVVLGRLWSAGLVRPAAHEARPHGGRPPLLWEVNPALAAS